MAYDICGLDFVPDEEDDERTIFVNDPFLGALIRAHESMKLMARRHGRFIPKYNEIAQTEDHILRMPMAKLMGALMLQTYTLSPDFARTQMSVQSRVRASTNTVYFELTEARAAVEVYLEVI